MSDRRPWSALLLLIFLARPVHAQLLTIHDHPEKAAYNSPAEWFCPSFQGHWDPTNAVVPAGNPNSVLGHLHVEPCFPQDAEIPAGMTVRIPFMLMLFQYAGQIREFSGVHMRDIIWDDTGSSAMPVMIGDPSPNGLKMWHGTFLFDPAQNDGSQDFRYGLPDHGWALNTIQAKAFLDNGDVQTVGSMMRFWSNKNPSAPIAPYTGDGAVSLRIGNFVESPRDLARGGTSIPNTLMPFGAAVIEFPGWIPLAPIDHDWPVYPSNAYNYGSIPNELGIGGNIGGVFDIRKDMALHTCPAPGCTGTPVGGFYPSQLGPDFHKLAFTWCSSSPSIGTPSVTPNETSCALLVLPMTVAAMLMPNPPVTLKNDARILSIAAPESTGSGTAFDTVVSVLNSGTKPWGVRPPGSGATTGYYFLRPAFPYAETTWGNFNWAGMLTTPVAPGERVAFTLHVTAPLTTGLTSLHWAMQQDGIEKFGNSNQRMVLVLPTGTAPTTCQDPTATNVGGPLPCVYPPPAPVPVNCVVGPWGVLSMSTTDTPAVTAGSVQTRTETTMTLEQRAIVTQPANGAPACPVN